MNQETADKDTVDLKVGGYFLYDDEAVKVLPVNLNSFTVVKIPLTKMARELGNLLIRDTIAMGAILTLLGNDMEIAYEYVKKEFAAKGDELVKENISALEAGSEHIKKFYLPAIKEVLIPMRKKTDRIIINGNEAIAVGSIGAGMQFASIYPMTPISNILHFLAPLQDEYGFVFKQPEDEVSAINMAIGASFAGARSMVATSGGGFCLMTEAYGLAGITETGLVIVEGMRGGPATGLPTWTGQADLRFVLHAHQGEFPRIILAPGDSEEAYEAMFDAFNLADKYQTPVLVLVDKQITESHQSFEPFTTKDKSIDRGKFTNKKITDYKRYADSSDGISLRAPAGSGNHMVANSDEHDEYGWTTEESEMRNIQMKKRMKKLETCKKQDMKGPVVYGPEKADLTLVSWGSSKGAILEAMKEFPNVNFIHTSWISPFPAEKLKEKLLKCKKILNIEGNYTAQFGGLLAESTGIRIEDNFLKYDGRPFFPEEIAAEIKKRI
jgi:2-oxoglutarate ferredoxin oxidoreductase subunit alpha